MNDSTSSNLSAEEWKVLRNLADGRSNLIKVPIMALQWQTRIEMTSSRKILDNYGIPIHTRMLNLTKIFLLF